MSDLAPSWTVRYYLDTPDEHKKIDIVTSAKSIAVERAQRAAAQGVWIGDTLYPARSIYKIIVFETGTDKEIR